MGNISTFKNAEKIFIIAELSANHKGNKEHALETVRAAKRAGADAIKLQTYTADTITLDSNKEDFVINSGSIWDGRLLYDLYQEAYTPWEWHADLFSLAQEEGLLCFSSPFDRTAVDFLEELSSPIYKIASFEITDIPLIKYVASKGKPVIISTGIADFEDIKLAVESCREVGNNDITILKCTSSYPATIDDSNLLMIRKYAEDFNVKVGLSDHTLGTIVPITSVALGAKVIEKHLILDKSIGGPDAAFSLDEEEFKEMVTAVRNAEKALGRVNYQLTEKQRSSKAFSRSLYVTKNIEKGGELTYENVRSVRPGLGMHPKYLEEVIGQVAKKELYKGDRLDWSLIERD